MIRFSPASARLRAWSSSLASFGSLLGAPIEHRLVFALAAGHPASGR
jgi:hypothetical protein